MSSQSAYVCVGVHGWLHVWEGERGCVGREKGEGDLNVVLASKGVAIYRVGSKGYNCL